MDITEILKDGDERALLKLWRVAADRRALEWVVDKAREQGDDEGVAGAERMLADVPPVTALQSLAANRRLVDVLSGQRWVAMRQAREEGASWEQVGAALAMTRQAAWEWYRKQIEVQERHAARFHDAPRARAVLGDPAGDPVGGPDGDAPSSKPLEEI